MSYPEGTYILLLAMLAQDGLMIVLLFALGIGRFQAASGGKAKRGADGNLIFPKKLVWLSDCVNNQFQLPLLFFVAALVAMQINAASDTFAMVAWIFVVFRFIHAGIFVTSNHVLSRFLTFVVGAIALLILWGMLALRILAA